VQGRCAAFRQRELAHAAVEAVGGGLKQNVKGLFKGCLHKP
jgi:hypothetical protein